MSLARNADLRAGRGRQTQALERTSVRLADRPPRDGPVRLGAACRGLSPPVASPRRLTSEPGGTGLRVFGSSGLRAPRPLRPPDPRPHRHGSSRCQPPIRSRFGIRAVRSPMARRTWPTTKTYPQDTAPLSRERRRLPCRPAPHRVARRPPPKTARVPCRPGMRRRRPARRPSLSQRPRRRAPRDRMRPRATLHACNSRCNRRIASRPRLRPQSAACRERRLIHAEESVERRPERAIRQLARRQLKFVIVLGIGLAHRGPPCSPPATAATCRAARHGASRVPKPTLIRQTTLRGIEGARRCVRHEKRLGSMWTGGRLTHVNAARRIGRSRAGTAQAKPSCDNGAEVHERASPNSMRLAAAIARKKQSSPARRLARPPPSNFEPAPPPLTATHGGRFSPAVPRRITR
ncbi:hypothetical protein X989_1084 [Burkholderia pseudomallei MSHR4378]|nr:hypothetical protein X989_1084 [Burkholderia pseudomallei MSHR4378]